MDQYPDEDEEYELLYHEHDNDFEPYEIEENVAEAEPIPVSNKNGTNQEKISSVRPFIGTQSPELSQIPFDRDENQIDVSAKPVNRCLFGLSTEQRTSSTPIAEKPLQKFQRVSEELRNKRQLERDLFGNIDDLDGEVSYCDSIVKKARTEEVRDMEMIEQILEMRTKLQSSSNNLKQNLMRLNEVHAFKMRNLSYSVPQWPFLPLVRSDDERIYVRYHSEEYEDHFIEDINVLSKGYGGLLGDNKQQIWADAGEIILEQTKVTEQLSPNVSETNVPKVLKEDQLWVEKYKPKKYIDLLSAETVNRSLLYWLKMWQKVVFGKEFQSKNNLDKQERNAFNKKTGRFEPNGGKSYKKRRQELNTNLDEIGRPIQKVALLGGLPGLGKTTLAHIIARHAGYAVREINASDDRSPEAFKLALENGTQMTSVLNADNRPNCIILDEIDGAPKQSIDFLIKFVTDKVTDKVKKKGAKGQRNILKRPIICICNDLYKPALRQLRQIAFIVTFPPIESMRLAERLEQIARKERLRTDLGALMALAETSGYDIRSCLATMQFFNVQKKALKLQDVLGGNLGQKDRHQGLFDIWKAIFKIQRPQKELKKNAPKEETQIAVTEMTTERRVQNVLNMVHSGADYERLMQGVFENYLQQKMPDSYMNGIVEALQWFCFSDNVNDHINRLQNYSCYPYLQYGFAVWHLLFASLSWPKINFPTRDFEFHQKIATQKNIFQAFERGIPPNVSGIGSGVVILLETVPLLKRILSPDIRPLPMELLKPKELNDVRHTVEIMTDLGLVYTQIQKPDGTFAFQLEPDLESLCQFPGYPGLSLTYYGRQLIGREVQLENIRRTASINKTRQTVEAVTRNDNLKKNLTNALQTNKAKETAKPAKKSTNIKETVYKDLFGRVKCQSTATSAEESRKDAMVKSPIWYHYKEGFNNAVRKDIHMNQLL